MQGRPTVFADSPDLGCPALGAHHSPEGEGSWTVLSRTNSSLQPPRPGRLAGPSSRGRRSPGCLRLSSLTLRPVSGNQGQFCRTLGERNESEKGETHRTKGATLTLASPRPTSVTPGQRPCSPGKLAPSSEPRPMPALQNQVKVEARRGREREGWKLCS